MVSWSPVQDVRGYTVSYVSGETVNTVTVKDPQIQSAIISELIAGVVYIITAQGFSDFPGPVSDPITVNLTGKLHQLLIIQYTEG